MNLANVPITISGDWGDMLTESALRVLERTRASCFEGFLLRSDEEPSELSVHRRLSGPPAVWLHSDAPKTASIIVNNGEQDWSQLSYQFGHELGHVVANSWHLDSIPKPPSHWLEEALVEAFALNGIERLAVEWRKNPPFSNDNSFGDALLQYRNKLLAAHLNGKSAPVIPSDWPSWFNLVRGECETHPNLNNHAKVFSVSIVNFYQAEPKAVSCLCALNRWPERSELPIDQYLKNWQRSCKELNVCSKLPDFLKRV